jgi:phosphatidylglycerophosphatase A
LVKSQKRYNQSKPQLLEYLEKQGITLQAMIDTALELFVPHPGVETKEKAIDYLVEEFNDALSDVNVSCMVVACYLVEEDAKAGLVPGLTGGIQPARARLILVPGLTQDRIAGRPGLVADELLGICIANYIAGARGIFEFIRFDQTKPGILKKLGPIMNDAIGGLIAGCSSKMYTQAIRQSEKRLS